MSKKKVNKKGEYWNNVAAILAIILLFLLVGLFFEKEKEIKRIEDKEKNQRRLKTVEYRIKILQSQKESIETREKKILLLARIIISVILVTSNYLYYHYCLFFLTLSDILDFNAAILLGYAFIAYILYGTIDKFVLVLKLKITHILRRNHIDSLTELEYLLDEKKSLLKELENVDKMEIQTVNQL